MKRFLTPIFLLLLSTLACNLPALVPADPAFTPASTSTLTPVPSPTHTPSSTPTSIPSPTPTFPPEVRIDEADHALFYGDYQSALSGYMSAFNTSTDPDLLAAALLGQGQIHYQTGIYPNALNEFRAIIHNYPGSTRAAEAHYFMAETLMLLDRYSEAADAFSSYLNLRPGVLDAFINERRGDALTAAGDYGAALISYTTAVQSIRLPTNFQLELKLAQTYLAVGDYTTAQVVYDDIYSRTSSEAIKAQVDYALGQMYAAQEQPEQATSAYLDAVLSYPQAYYSYLSLIELVNADYPIDEVQRGLVDYYAGQYNVALAAFDRYLETYPTDPSVALYYKGLILREQGDPPGAITMWDAVIQGEPASPVWASAWEHKAYTLWAYQGEYLAGKQTLLDFVAAAPNHPRAAEFLFDAGRIAERDDRLDESARIWQRIPAEYPNSEYVYQSLFQAAICHYRLGVYAAAQDIFWQAQALATTPAERAGAYFWIGKAQLAQGDKESARASWEHAAPLDPTGYYSERSRDLLNNRPPFTPPEMIDLRIDLPSELRQAELWMRTTFNYPSSTDFSVPGILAGDPRFIRGRELWKLGLQNLAEAEFNNLRESAASDPLISFKLAVYLSDLGMYRLAILSARQVLDLAGLDDAGTLTAPLLFNHIRFGGYFPDLVIPKAEGNDFDPLFLWSVIRQESLFDASISSNAGAIGLMQIMPPTAEEIVANLGWPPDYDHSDLLRPEVNLTLGIDYLAIQRDNLGGDLYAALAAYNGGPGNASTWLTIANGDPDLFVEVVRFEETRKYLRSIYEIFNIYSRLYSRVP